MTGLKLNTTELISS